MARPQKTRCVNYEPEAVYFKPRGVPLSLLEEVVLSLDEMEAIRLKYVEGLDQVACAKRMKVSQSTLQRILTSANRKIAQALTQGKAIKIEGGIVRLVKK
ncbi:hypothetical protein A3I42_02840 [Candidatus Uhrbacteria bacterium RIFCSPLOWO2_02_FULL_49_11]|uniref:UPF0251 protein A3I42_02840 n=1 Tax=Candidatus Uhrbacteria bacterium RIFCSPLOWO2_02_FULL_49_11 TaxID=1802409 RepID=A0A1F7VCB8_9BACT|nr:MAG: hypothetical protein A3I42_02840 [Candidatus Uhrbacteria bacterium RIFCSPLOWO2_02_FULL_49_11]